jgi:2-polyprenyl-3-methyl-5-hydroxy-6-metoxy-1,4-benzoquinol methylase
MQLEKSPDMSGKDHFRLLYQNELDAEAEWLRRTAAEKVNSIEILLERRSIRPKTILELGCGIGAVITECQRRSLAKKYIGVDYAAEAIDYLRSTSTGIETFQGDITDPAFYVADMCDVVVMSHVLEHLEDPARFLTAMKKALKFGCVVIEVPLEDLVASRIKSIFKNRITNKAGHVQFFTASSFEELLRSNGLTIVDRRTYVPILDMDTVRSLSEKDRLTGPRRVIKTLTGHYLPRLLYPLWKRLYYAHHAVLCVAK